MTLLDVQLRGSRPLRFNDGGPVRAASAVVVFGDGWLIAQDDAVAGAWLRADGAVQRVPLLPPVDGHELFSEAAGTKRLKPDLEAACPMPTAGDGAVLLFGSGSLANRRHAVLVRPGVAPISRQLGSLYDRVADTLGIADEDLNLEGACVVGDQLHWFQRGIPARGVPSASLALPVVELLAAVRGDLDPAAIEVGDVRRYELGELAGVGLAITDVVILPGGRILASVGAEDTPDAVADGPLAGSGLALIDPHGEVVCVTPLEAQGPAVKLEGLAVTAVAGDGTPGGASLLGVVDQDDPSEPSLAIDLEVRWRG